MLHLVLIRFNVGVYQAGLERLKMSADAWMQHRMDLYTKYCLPSIQKQTNQDFTTCLFVDETTTQYKDQYDQLSQIIYKHRGVYILYPNSLQDLQRCVNEKMSKMGYDGTLITTRLDTDNIMGVNYIEQIQMVENEVIDYPYIIDQDEVLWYDVVNNTYLVRYNTVNIQKKPEFCGAFFSLVENKPPYITCFGAPHVSFRKKYPFQRYMLTKSVGGVIIHQANWDIRVKPTVQMDKETYNRYARRLGLL